MTTTAHTTIWFDRPAESWFDGFPLGNGRSGAMLFGPPTHQVLALNDEEFWSPGPVERDFAGARDAFEIVRERLAAEDVLGAQAAAGPLLGSPHLGAAYQPLGHVLLESESPVTDFRRELDLSDGSARLSWSADGGAIEQHLLAVRQPSVFILSQRGNPHPTSLTFHSPFPLTSVSPAAAHGQWQEVAANRRLVADSYRLPDGHGRRLQFTMGVRVLHGAYDEHPDSFELAAGDWAIAIAVGTDRTGDPRQNVQDRLDAAQEAGIDVLDRLGRAEHRAVFERASIRLRPSGAADESLRNLPTSARVHGVRAGGVDDGLLGLLMDYGRYLLIASTVGGSLPPTLQGVWNSDTEPAWSSNWTLNINTQMNLWAADSFGVTEGADVLADLVDSLAAAGRRTARELYGSDGWVVHHNSDGWYNTAPTTLVEVGLFPGAGLWLLDQLWQHHKFYPDHEFELRLLPLLEGAIQFLETWLVDDADGFLTTSPSSSPENGYLLGSTERPRSRAADPEYWRHGWLGTGPTLDLYLVRDILSAGIEAAGLAGADAARTQRWQGMLDRLRPVVVDGGEIPEWTTPHNPLELGHRHLSRLYAVFPGTGDYRSASSSDAAIRTLLAHQTGVESTSNGWGGWSRVWAAGVWARLGDGERAAASLDSLLRTGIAPGSLLHAFPEFDGTPGADAVHQSEANLGVPAIVAEMVVQVVGDELHLLPAIPSRWRSGSVRSLRARGGVEVSFDWTDGSVTEVELVSSRPQRLIVVMPNDRREVTLAAGIPHLEIFGGARPAEEGSHE